MDARTVGGGERQGSMTDTRVVFEKCTMALDCPCAVHVVGRAALADEGVNLDQHDTLYLVAVLREAQEVRELLKAHGVTLTRGEDNALGFNLQPLIPTPPGPPS